MVSRYRLIELDHVDDPEPSLKKLIQFLDTPDQQCITALHDLSLGFTEGYKLGGAKKFNCILNEEILLKVALLINPHNDPELNRSAAFFLSLLTTEGTASIDSPSLIDAGDILCLGVFNSEKEIATICTSAFIQWLQKDPAHHSSLSSNLLFYAAPSFLTSKLPTDNTQGRSHLVKKARLLNLFIQLLLHNITYPFASSTVAAAEELKKTCELCTEDDASPLAEEWADLLEVVTVFLLRAKRAKITVAQKDGNVEELLLENQRLKQRISELESILEQKESSSNSKYTVRDVQFSRTDTTEPFDDVNGTFYTDDSEFHVRFYVAPTPLDKPTGRIVWVCKDSHGVAPRNYIIVECSLSEVVSNIISSHATLPRAWPVGDYEVQLYIDDALVRAAPFKVIERRDSKE